MLGQVVQQLLYLDAMFGPAGNMSGRWCLCGNRWLGSVSKVYDSSDCPEEGGGECLWGGGVCGVW